MAHREYTFMDATAAARSESIVDLAPAQAYPSELPSGDNPVLAAGEGRNPPLPLTRLMRA